MSPDGVDWSVLAPAFLAGILVLATHVPLGIEVLRRGIIFIDLAIAQIAALGVIVAHLLDLDGGWATQGFAAVAALGGALLLTLAERRWAEIQEALIGLLFVLGASLGILLLAGDPHGGEHLKDLLAGQILWVGSRQLLAAAAVSAAVLAAWFGLRRRLPRAGFYLLFAATVTVSVQLVGVFLVFASLIAPAVAARGRGPGVGYAFGAAGYGLGLLASARWDLPAGAAIVCALCGVALLGLALAPRVARPGGMC